MNIKTLLNRTTPFIGVGAVYLFVIALCFAAVSFFGQAKAEEPKPRMITRSEKLIAENQEVITKTREAHIEFMTAKDDNEFQIRKLREQCYEFDWKTMTASEIEGCDPEDLLE